MSKDFDTFNEYINDSKTRELVLRDFEQWLEWVDKNNLINEINEIPYNEGKEKFIKILLLSSWINSAICYAKNN